MSSNTQKDKCTFNELISHCVQEEERIKKTKIQSVHLVSTSRKKKRKRAKHFNKDTAEGTSKQKKGKKQDKEFTYYLCKKSSHIRKEFPEYIVRRVKKGNLLTLVCLEVNLIFVPIHTFCVDSSATTHGSMSLQDCL